MENLSMKRILITGGCGFIGSNFVRWKLENDPNVQISNIDALTYAGNLDNLRDLKRDARYVFIHGSILDRPLLKNVMNQGFDALINFAAESHVDRSIGDPFPFLSTNVLGTHCLLDAARIAAIPRFLQISTDEVYGSLEPGDPPFTEQTPLAPNSPYAASKAAADMLVWAAHHTYGLNTVITRCSNNYGPFQFPEKLIPLFITNALANRPLPIYGDGCQIRDWIHVLDHCRGIDATLLKGQPGAVYNLGACCEKRNLDITRMILRLCGKSDTLVRYVPDRPGHDRRYAVNPSRAQIHLDWKATVPFDQGLTETVAWYDNHPHWVERIRSGAYQATELLAQEQKLT
jgi:dTDP-glucose 4,6-dehydratase